MVGRGRYSTATMERSKPKAAKVINKLDVKKVEEEVFGFGVEEENDTLVKRDGFGTDTLMKNSHTFDL